MHVFVKVHLWEEEELCSEYGRDCGFSWQNDRWDARCKTPTVHVVSALRPKRLQARVQRSFTNRKPCSQWVDGCNKWVLKFRTPLITANHHSCSNGSKTLKLYSFMDFLTPLRNVYIYLFICGLFNDAASNSNCMASNDRIIVNNELERIWKEAVVA
jgi:hypothetical protein